MAGAAAEALEKAAGAQTRPAHSPTGTALRGEEGEREPERENVTARVKGSTRWNKVRREEMHIQAKRRERC